MPVPTMAMAMQSDRMARYAGEHAAITAFCPALSRIRRETSQCPSAFPVPA